MGDNLAEFRNRGATLFRSLRPKKPKSSKKPKSGGSSSIFTSLLLANYEQQMQFDPNVNFSTDISFDKSRKMIRDMKEKKPQDHNLQAEQAVNEEVGDERDESTDNEDVKDIVDKDVFGVYENILFVVVHRLKPDCDQDLPTVNEQSALDYVRDAFGISENKHNELFEFVKPNSEVGSKPVDELLPRGHSQRKRFEAVNAHTCLTKILLKHELELSQTPRFYWSGKFSFLASSILTLHSEWLELSGFELLLTKWSAYVDIHPQHPLDLKVFIDILKSMLVEGRDRSMAGSDTMISFIPSCFRASGSIDFDEETNQLKTQDDDILNEFWKSVGILNQSFLRFISDLIEENDLEYLKVMILRKVCTIIKTLKAIERSRMNMNFEESIKASILKGTSKHISKTLNKEILKGTESVKTIDELIRVLDIAIADFNLASERFDPIFKEILSFSYSRSLYQALDSKLSTIIKPKAIEISKSTSGIIDNFRESGDDHKSARSFFQLFLKAKAFADLGLEFNSSVDFQFADYFKWFLEGIDKWCDTSIFSTFPRIQRSILLDNLKPLDNKLNHSQSAVDCSTILDSTIQFWETSSSTNIENVGSLALCDVCRFAIVYFESIADQVEKCHTMKQYGIFKVPLEICVGVSDVTFIMENTIALCSELMQKNVQDYTRLQQLMKNCLEHGATRKSKLMEAAMEKMKPTIRKLLLEGADVVIKGTLLGERLIVYVEDSLLSLEGDLEPTDFKESKNVLLSTLLKVFSELVEKSLQINRPPAFFTNLRTIFHSLQDLFVDENEQKLASNENLNVKLQEIDSLLERHELNSSKLIHQYYKERYRMQENISRSPFNPCGVLSINCFFINNILKVTVLNAKNLIPLGVNRKCDSFVKINIIPEKLFPQCQSFKTKVELDTHFPLYDELFQFELTKEQRAMSDAIIFFNIKDKLLFTRNQCIAEAFLSFKDIPEFTQDQKFTKQIHLTLTRLQSDDMEPLKALQERSHTGDKAAKEFLSKIKYKIPELPPKSPVIDL